MSSHVFIPMNHISTKDTYMEATCIHSFQGKKIMLAYNKSFLTLYQTTPGFNNTEKKAF